MGVKLHNLIKSEKRDLSDFRGSRVAVDGMQMLFQLLNNPYYMSRNYGKGNKKYRTDASHRVYYHLYGWVQKVIHFLRAQILPIVVFDGPPSPLKNVHYRYRERDFLQAKRKYETAIAREKFKTAQKIALSKDYMFQNCIRESKGVLKACGVPVIDAPSEAEAQCVALEKQGRADYVVSTDYDAILYGAKRIIRSITFQTRRKVGGKWKTVQPQVEYIDVEKELARIDLERADLIEMSFLLGNDYFEGIKNVGPVKAEQSIRLFGDIPGMKKAHPNLFRNLHMNDYRAIKSLFMKPKGKKIDRQYYLQPFTPSSLKYILLEGHGLSPKRTRNYIKRLGSATKKIRTRTDFMGSSGCSLKIENWKETLRPEESHGQKEKKEYRIPVFPRLENNNGDRPLGSHEFNRFLRRRLDRGLAHNRDPRAKKHKNQPSGIEFTQALYVEEDETQENFEKRGLKGKGSNEKEGEKAKGSKTVQKRIEL
ncbi:MAG TPA: hypothetical protein VKO42_01315 [Patescibacteria group bacterium]|nr:hypothetical protein [Patescibacteria group bacterium]